MLLTESDFRKSLSVKRKFLSEFHNLLIIFLLPKYIYHPTSRVSLCLFLYWGRIFLYTDQFFWQDYLDFYAF